MTDPSLNRLDGFQVAVSYSDERAEVVVVGEVDVATAPTMEREIKAALAVPIRDVTVHLGRVTFLDSSGISALMRAQQSATERGATFALRSVPVAVRRVLEITGVSEALGLTPAPAAIPPAAGDNAV